VGQNVGDAKGAAAADGDDPERLLRLWREVVADEEL
jgi:hypothetical protein